MGVKISDYVLRGVLVWAKSQNFKTDASTTLSIRVWKEVGGKAMGHSNQRGQGTYRSDYHLEIAL